MIWGFAAAMLVVALVIVLFPLWRPAGQPVLDSNTANVELLRDQLRELDDELAAGNFTQMQYDAAREDLEAAVAADLADDEARSGPLSKKNRQLLSMVLLVIISSGSIGLYRQVTTYQQIPPSQQPEGQAAGRELPSLKQMIEVLAAELRKNPDNVEGWRMLGRSYLITEQIEEAAGAYARAYELAGDQDPVLLVDYAEVIAFTRDNRMQGRPLELVNRALAIVPGMPKALWLKGLASFQQDDYAMAISLWDKALQGPELADKAQQTLRAYIAEARQKMRPTGEQGTVSPQIAGGGTQTPNESAAEASIKVQVSLDDAISGQAGSEETVFVFARAASGPPMPLAVQKLAVADLPVTVILDDSMAMLAGMNLSSQRQVVVGARVSRSGSPMPQTGDLQGMSGVIEPGKDVQVSVVISETLK